MRVQQECDRCNRARIVYRENTMTGNRKTGLVTEKDNVLTLDEVRVMSTAKRGNLKKDQLVKLAINFIAHIDRLELDLAKYKMAFRELRELKKASSSTRPAPTPTVTCQLASTRSTGTRGTGWTSDGTPSTSSPWNKTAPQCPPTTL
jgi:hypothetical protein